MSNIKLMPEIKKETRDFKAEYYESVESLKDSLQSILTLAYNEDGQMIVISSGVDSKTAVWMCEEFKLTCIAGLFEDS
jgi:hypothetical protein